MTIVTRPEHDPTTRYLSTWCYSAFKTIKKIKGNFVDLWRKKATRADLEPLVHANKNSHLLFGRITYAVSCNAARGLGAVVAAHPNTAFIGYRDKFVFGYQYEKLTRHLEDNRAAPFMELTTPGLSWR